MTDYDIIISFGIHNNCLDDIQLCETFGNKTLCIIFDEQEEMPQEHLIGRPRPSLVYIPLYKKKVEEIKLIKKRSCFYPFTKTIEEVISRMIETDECYAYYLKSNKNILLLYTNQYEWLIPDIVKKYGDNIKRKLKRNLA